MKAGMRPIPRGFDQTVFHRIVVNVIAVRAVIPFIPDRMFPKPPLPDPLLAFLLHGDCGFRWRSTHPTLLPPRKNKCEAAPNSLPNTFPT